MRESPSVWAFPTILTLHTIGLGILVGASWLLDLRLLGFSRNTPLSAFRWVFPAIGFGLVLNLAILNTLNFPIITSNSLAIMFCDFAALEDEEARIGVIRRRGHDSPPFVLG